MISCVPFKVKNELFVRNALVMSRFQEDLQGCTSIETGVQPQRFWSNIINNEFLPEFIEPRPSPPKRRGRKRRKVWLT